MYQSEYSGAEIDAGIKFTQEHNTDAESHNDIRQSINTLVANKANKVQDNWIEATLENGWTGNLKYRRNQIGQLEISAKVTAGTAAANTVIATLPDGYRPSQYTPIDMFNITAGVMVNTPVFVHTDGRISLRSTLVSGNLYHFMVVGV